MTPGDWGKVASIAVVIAGLLGVWWELRHPYEPPEPIRRPDGFDEL